jgi:hypothetical protein
VELEVGMIVRWPGHGFNGDQRAKVLFIDYPKQEALIEWLQYPGGLPLDRTEVKPYAPVSELRIIIGADNKSFLDGSDITEVQNKLRTLIEGIEDGESEFKRSACQAITDLLPLVEHLPISGPASRILGQALIVVLSELGVCK